MRPLVGPRMCETSLCDYEICRLSGFERRKEQTEQARRTASFCLSHGLYVLAGRKHNRQWHRDSFGRGQLHPEIGEVHFVGGA